MEPSSNEPLNTGQQPRRLGFLQSAKRLFRVLVVNRRMLMLVIWIVKTIHILADSFQQSDDR
jgi:hypothetical protein